MPDVVITGGASAELDWALRRLPPGFRPIVVVGPGESCRMTAARSHGAMTVDSASGTAGLMAATSAVVCLVRLGESVDPRELAELAGPVADGSTDLAMAVRDWPRASWHWPTRWSAKVLAKALRKASSVPLSDIGPMRAGRRDALRSVEVQGSGDLWWFEMVLRCQRAGWRITEIPVRCGGDPSWAQPLLGRKLRRATTEIESIRDRIDRSQRNAHRGGT